MISSSSSEIVDNSNSTTIVEQMSIHEYLQQQDVIRLLTHGLLLESAREPMEATGHDGQHKQLQEQLLGIHILGEQRSLG